MQTNTVKCAHTVAQAQTHTQTHTQTMPTKTKAPTVAEL